MTTNDDMTPRQPDENEPLEQPFGDELDLVDETVARITDAEVNEHLRKVLSESGPWRKHNAEGWADLAGLSGSLEVAIGAARRAAADAQLKAKTANDELRRTQEAVAKSRQQAEQIVADARTEADEALERALKMIRNAGEKAEQIISDAHKEAEQIITAARNQQVHQTAEAGLTHTELEISRPPAEPLYRLLRSLARRSQSLLHRQLSLLDQMERQATDSEALDDLFRLDHLTTRMRRHAEGLLILAGAPPGRGWSNPVRMVDVMRGAIAEVEDYARVSVATRSQAALAGSAVADVVHLLAELIENATTLSPPNMSVRVTGDTVANGFAIEVEDRGFGMSPTRLAELNERLANPPEFNPADSEQLGLFVVSQLAKRHGIRVTLKASPSGGTAAVVLIPRHLVVTEEAFRAGLPGELASVTLTQLTTHGSHADPGCCD